MRCSVSSAVVIERHHGGGAFEAIASYCRAVRSGPLVVVSGTAATGEDGRALHPGDTYQQTVVSFERALEGLGSFGGAAAHVVRTRVYLTPDADWREAVRAHHELFEGVNPANTTLFVAGLIPEGSLVEVELDAWVERGEELA
jgi:enamine deaminase RidA (YjgF/YER057c/UK114 family)